MIQKFIKVISDKAHLSDDDIKKITKLYNDQRFGFVEAVESSGIVQEQIILETLSAVYSMPFISKLFPGNTEQSFTDAVSIQFLKKKCMVPLKREDSTTFIALHDPCELTSADDIANILQLNEYELILAPKAEIFAVINNLYNKTNQSTQQLMENMEENSSSIIKEIEETSDLLDDTSDAPVIRLVNHMISQSVKANASDIHIEPFQDTIKIRYRIDGILYDLLEPPHWIQSALISRIKVMADMNIAEKRIPQDGRFEVRIGDQKIDIRVSTVPTSFGERLVMRLLNKSGSLLTLSEFGISSSNLKIFEKLIHMNNGMILVTGPTGSGKTTTLYAALSSINSPDKNIITIEDPVEYNLKGIGQIQVNPKVGMTFATGLRSIVRQDPDIILVGEIRDLETSEIAIQSALTGHLVFSTLHTNDSAGAVTRLVDLGIEPYLITSSVKAVIAQRLIRILCNKCKVRYFPDVGEISALNIQEHDMQEKIYRAQGCSECFGTGYTGRQAVFEIMQVDDNLKKIILNTSDSNIIKSAALKQGMTSLRQNGIEKILKGVTTIEEVLRVTQD